MELGLKGKKAIITGGSRGIGKAIAETFAGEGVQLALCARNSDGLAATARELEARGPAVFHKAVDVGDGAALRAYIAEAIAALGGLDILVHNASAFGGVDEESWVRSFDIDLMGAVRGVEAALPALERSDAASVIFTGTTAAVETFIGPRSYNALKAAMIVHSNGLSQELGPKGIRVNTVSPGPIYFEGGPWGRHKKNNPAVYEATRDNCALGRMGTPQEVANAVAFIASPAAAFITGVNLIVDGGLTKRVNF